MNVGVYQHFRKEERATIDQIASYISEAELNYAPVLTDFFNPRERFIAQALIGKNSAIQMATQGGYQNADRKRVLFYPQYFEPQVEDFEIQVLEVNYPVKFASLHHGQILGALVHSGITRDVLGDIITDGTRWQLIVEKKIAPFLVSQLDRIGRTKVKLNPQTLAELLMPESAWQEVHLLVSSQRIDSIIASSYHFSRGKAKELIENAKVQLNWMEVDRPDYVVSTRDIISVRGYGRIRLDAILGTTHKGKLKAEMAIIRK